MNSRYDYMRPSDVMDIDGEFFPDPLTINYQRVLNTTDELPISYALNLYDLKKLWLSYYKQTSSVDMDDILYTVNGIPHVGLLEPEDSIYRFNTNAVDFYSFKSLDRTHDQQQ